MGGRGDRGRPGNWLAAALQSMLCTPAKEDGLIDNNVAKGFPVSFNVISLVSLVYIVCVLFVYNYIL